MPWKIGNKNINSNFPIKKSDILSERHSYESNLISSSMHYS
jgi:hypothetical protein